MEWHPDGWSVCLPLLIFPCTIKSRSSFLAPAHLSGPGCGVRVWLPCLHVNVNRSTVFSPVLLAWQRMANWTVYKPNRCLCKTHNTNQEVELRQNVQFLNTITSATGHQMHFLNFRCPKLWPQWDLTCKQRQQEQKRCQKKQLPLRVFPELTFCRTTNIQRTTHVKMNENWTYIYTWRMKLWQRQKWEHEIFRPSLEKRR